MRKNAKKVIEAFLRGEAATGDSKGTISTDGDVIWSYAMPIAARVSGGGVLLLAYDKAPSHTTASHVHACRVGLSRIPMSMVDDVSAHVQGTKQPRIEVRRSRNGGEAPKLIHQKVYQPKPNLRFVTEA